MEIVVQAKRSNESLGGMFVMPKTDVTNVSGRKLLMLAFSLIQSKKQDLLTRW